METAGRDGPGAEVERVAGGAVGGAADYALPRGLSFAIGRDYGAEMTN